MILVTLKITIKSSILFNGLAELAKTQIAKQEIGCEIQYG